MSSQEIIKQVKALAVEPEVKIAILQIVDEAVREAILVTSKVFGRE